MFKRIRFNFDKARFIEESQANYLAPQYKKLKDGLLSEWLLAFLFVLIFGLIHYPICALSSIGIVAK